MSERLVYICEICQTVLDIRRCEAICPNCGRRLDCSDLALLPANGSLIREDEVVLRPGSNPGDLIPIAAREESLQPQMNTD